MFDSGSILIIIVSHCSIAVTPDTKNLCHQSSEWSCDSFHHAPHDHLGHIPAVCRMPCNFLVGAMPKLRALHTWKIWEHQTQSNTAKTHKNTPKSTFMPNKKVCMSCVYAFMFFLTELQRVAHQLPQSIAPLSKSDMHWEPEIRWNPCALGGSGTPHFELWMNTN